MFSNSYGRTLEFIEIGKTKLMVAEIRPLEILVTFQEKEVYTTKWMNLHIWQEVQSLLYEITQEYERTCTFLNTSLAQIKTGASVKIGYRFTEYAKCSCMYLTPRKDVWSIDETLGEKGGKYTSYQTTPHSLLISVYPLNLKSSEVKLAPSKVFRSNSKIDNKLLKALMTCVGPVSPYSPRQSTSSSNSKETPSKVGERNVNGSPSDHIKKKIKSLFDINSDDSMDVPSSFKELENSCFSKMNTNGERVFEENTEKRCSFKDHRSVNGDESPLKTRSPTIDQTQSVKVQDNNLKTKCERYTLRSGHKRSKSPVLKSKRERSVRVQGGTMVEAGRKGNILTRNSSENATDSINKSLDMVKSQPYSKLTIIKNYKIPETDPSHSLQILERSPACSKVQESIPEYSSQTKVHPSKSPHKRLGRQEASVLFDETDSLPDLERVLTDDSFPDLENAPRDYSLPGLENAPRDDSLPDLENAPRDDSLPDLENAPRDDSLPDLENAPRDDSLPDLENAPRDDSLPDLENAPRDDSLPDLENAPRDDSLPNCEGYIDSTKHLSEVKPLDKMVKNKYTTKRSFRSKHRKKISNSKCYEKERKKVRKRGCTSDSNAQYSQFSDKISKNEDEKELSGDSVSDSLSSNISSLKSSDNIGNTKQFGKNKENKSIRKRITRSSTETKYKQELTDESPKRKVCKTTSNRKRVKGRTKGLFTSSSSSSPEQLEFSEVHRNTISRMISKSCNVPAKDFPLSFSNRTVDNDLGVEDLLQSDNEDKYEESFLQSIRDEFSKLTEEDMKSHLKRNLPHLKKIIQGKVSNDRDKKFMRGPNAPRIFTAETFVCLFDDEFYEFLSDIISEELGNLMITSNRDIPVACYSIGVLLPELLKRILLTFPFIKARGISADEECERIFLELTLTSSLKEQLKF